MAEKTLSEPRDIGVHHYKTGRDSWKFGARHYWIRIRGLLTGLLLTVGTMGAPWWWQDRWSWQPLPDQVCIPIHLAGLILGLTLTLIVVITFFYARARAQRSLECKDKLHAMSHIMRDSFCEVLLRTGARRSKHDLAHERRHLLSSSNDIAKAIVDYYKALTGAKCVGAVIRIAEDVPDDGKEESHYVSIGRAGSIDHTRAESSEPIMANEGIPKLFRSGKGGANGVLFFDDLEKAIRFGVYKETNNEKNYPDDYKCVIAVPLNGFDGHKKDLIGLLTITGRSKRKLLQVHHVDLLKAIGDRLAEHYSATIARLSASNRMPDLHQDEIGKTDEIK
jgi:hypothetical protein